jgi:hypothetical protein
LLLSDGGTNKFIGLLYNPAVSAAWQCSSGDGTTATNTTTGVTVTASHYYDMILDLSTTGTLVCSVADNGGAYTTVTKTTNLPAAATLLAPEAFVTDTTASLRSLEVAYFYLEQN